MAATTYILILKAKKKLCNKRIREVLLPTTYQAIASNVEVAKGGLLKIHGQTLPILSIVRKIYFLFAKSSSSEAELLRCNFKEMSSTYHFRIVLKKQCLQKMLRIHK